MALTSADRVWAIEQALRHYSGRYVEQRIRAAWSDGPQAARDEARRLCRSSGQGGPEGLVDGMRTQEGLYVRRGGREGVVRWREIAEVCAPSQQESML